MYYNIRYIIIQLRKITKLCIKMYISSKILLGIAVQRMYNKYGKEKDL